MVPPKAVSSGKTRVQNGGGGNLGADPVAAQLYHAAGLVGVGNKFCVTPPGVATSASLGQDLLTVVNSPACHQRLEARVRIELTRKGFADLSLTTWVPRRLAERMWCRCGEVVTPTR
jgi:hypothetical protein